MPYELYRRGDRILHLAFIGDQSDADMEAFRDEFLPFVEAATDDDPLLIVVDGTRSAKFSSDGRKVFLELNKNLKIAKVAVWGANRYARVLVSFVIKATGRNNIRFTETEQEALDWLEAED